jgi:putative protease
MTDNRQKPDRPPERPEIISPAGEWTSLRAALQSGADAVYFGAEGYNMRAASKGFRPGDFAGISRVCRSYGAKAYLALNSIIYDHELPDIETVVLAAGKGGIDAVICWDMAVIETCRRHGMPFHISTQASVSNFESVRFYVSLGARMIVLARELTLDQISGITSRIRSSSLPVTIECFVHGAMCVAVSGRCFMSQELFGRSANRGACLQPCRRAYRIVDPEEGHELELGTDYVMSPKDLCTITFLDRLVEAGIGGFKIEGRNRSPEYVGTTTSCYRRALDCCLNHHLDPGFSDMYGTLSRKLEQELKTVYNRGFSSGFCFGLPADSWTKKHGSLASERKEYVGIVQKYYPKAGVAEILVQARGVRTGETLSIQGRTTGLVSVTGSSLYKDDRPADDAGKGEIFTIRCGRVHRNDTVYVLIPL